MTEFLTLFTTGPAYDVFRIVGEMWFLWLPPALLFILWDVWVVYVKTNWLTNNKWVLLELNIPKEIQKSPRAMELVLTSLHNTRTGNIIEQFWNGFSTPFYSLEIASINGEVHFFIYTQDFFRNFVESQFYAQFPDMEIVEVDDYTKIIPHDIPNDEWKVWGAELGLTKEDIYPIKSYTEFKLDESLEEEEKTDPLVSMIEFLGSLKHGEHVWFQIIIQGAGSDWQKKGEKFLENMMGRKTFERPEENGSFMHTHHETEIMKAVERNIAKVGFKTGMRFVYVGKKDVFSPATLAAFLGITKQFSAMNFNGIAPKWTASVDYLFVKRRSYRRAKKIIDWYRKRSYFYPPYGSFLYPGKGNVKPFILNTEELATLFHFPGRTAEIPTFQRVEARKGEPPSSLPT